MLMKARGVRVAETALVQERQIADFRAMLKLLRSAPAMPCAFGCKDLGLQRYQFFLKAYLLAAGTAPRLLVDEKGTIRNVTWLPFLLVDTPRFGLELLSSAVVILVIRIRLFFLRLALRRGSQTR
jgi:hypothetical protein